MYNTYHEDDKKGSLIGRVRSLFGMLGALVVLIMATGCGPGMIKGTKVKATKRNKDVYAFIQKYRQYTTKGQWDRLLSLVSPRFHETRGTADPGDDYGYSELQRSLKSATFRKIKVYRFNFSVDKIDYPRPGEAKVYLRTWYTHRYPRGKYHPGFDTGPLRTVLVLEYSGRGWLIRRGI